MQHGELPPAWERLCHLGNSESQERLFLLPWNVNRSYSCSPVSGLPQGLGGLWAQVCAAAEGLWQTSPAVVRHQAAARAGFARRGEREHGDKAAPSAGEGLAGPRGCQLTRRPLAAGTRVGVGVRVPLVVPAGRPSAGRRTGVQGLGPGDEVAGGGVQDVVWALQEDLGRGAGGLVAFQQSVRDWPSDVA